MPKTQQAKIFDQEEMLKKREKEAILKGLTKKSPDLDLLKKANHYLFAIFSEEEKEKVWKNTKDNIECLLELIRTNRADVFPEKAFNYTTLGEIFSKGTKEVVETFIHSQFYREGMKQFLISEKYRRLIMDKIGKKLYTEIIVQI